MAEKCRAGVETSAGGWCSELAAIVPEGGCSSSLYGYEGGGSRGHQSHWDPV